MCADLLTCSPAILVCRHGVRAGWRSIRGRFCIDRWEASLVEATTSGEQPFSPYQSPNGNAVRAVTSSNTVPQGYISREQSDLACKASGKRLCREEEWVMACRGDPPRAFPYGDARQKGACNDSGMSALRVYYPESPDTFSRCSDERSAPEPASDYRCAVGGVCPVHQRIRCVRHGRQLARMGDVDAPHFRGGYYLDTHFNGDGCSYHTTAHTAEYHDYSTGFRCCRDPEGAKPGADSITK